MTFLTLVRQKEDFATDSIIIEAMSEKRLEQICGEHFNKKGHTQADMLPVILEQVYPKNDEFLRLRREKFWINAYEDCANKQS